jgi:LacI family transcriptional regulator, repressor for deo operon, udp, cdd, tsx, nupC, and nupG
MPPEPQQLSLADIARLAGVSLATASRALNDAYGVAPATRERVQQIADELQYVVSPEAARLASGTKGRIAVVVPHVERWFFGAIVGGLESVLSDAGLDVLLYHVDDEEERQRFFKQLPARRKVDAVVVVAFPVDEQGRARFEVMGVPVVSAGGQSGPYPYVCIDDEVAGRQAVQHLLRLGHRRVGMIEALDPAFPDRDRPHRSDGYFASLTEAGIPLDERLVVTIDWGGEQGAEAMTKLLSLPEPPTAVYAHSDEVALGALRTLRRAGLRVPEDVSMVGIDDHPLAALVDLTTVRQPVREQGVLAGQLLLALLRGDAVTPAVTVATELIVRRSTASPRE